MKNSDKLGTGGGLAAAMDSLVATDPEDDATDDAMPKPEGPESPAAVVADIRAQLDRLAELLG